MFEDVWVKNVNISSLLKKSGHGENNCIHGCNNQLNESRCHHFIFVSTFVLMFILIL